MKPLLSPTSASLGESPTQTNPIAFLDRAAGALRRWIARHAVLAELHRLDRATLDDLRIYPSDFAAIADGTYERAGSAANPPTDAIERSLAPPRIWPL